MKQARSVFVILVCLLVWVGCSSAYEIELDAAKAAVIRPSEHSDECRLLASFTLPDSLEEYSISFACVSFEADCSGSKGAVSFQAFSLARDWDGETVSWSGPWESDGGDWDESLSAYWINEAGSGETLYFDVTDFANSWLREPSKNFGVIVKVSGPFFGSFSVNETRTPKLRILY